jgi:hypothetical protein
VDGSVIEKIERFSRQGLERYVFKDGLKTGKIIPRLNQSKDAQNWLSMQPSPIDFCDGSGWGFGEVNEDNKLHGRGIRILIDGYIHIGYW